MSANIAFELGSTVALFGWLLLAIGSISRNQALRWWSLFMGGRFIPLVLALLYCYLTITFWGSSPDGDYSSLEGVKRLFESPGNLAAGWTHFLAFDLFVGRWIIDDSVEVGKRKWHLILCLPLTFLYGPVGLATYVAYKVIIGRQNGFLKALSQ
ncbi:ABA4-like family protein [uncultured Vibrio sp.]|uniref:ABA4-like family protein n=1 Tax=uncultured Vibrio sp. TaxID=114054 RepID=UPI0025EE5144|nr:ABA4-like family protein [uncultured Vibrio sp.]